MTKLQFEQMVQLRAKIMTIWTRTEPKLNAEGKKKLPGLIKLTRVNCLTGYDYTRLLDKYQSQNDLPTVDVKPRKWGTRDGNLVRHNGKTYVPILRRSSQVTYKMNGQEIPYDQVKPYLRDYSDGPPVSEYNLDNVVGVTVDGDFHEIEG